MVDRARSTCPGSATRVRRATHADAPAIARVHRASIRRLCSTCYTGAQIAAWTHGIEPGIYRRAMSEIGERMWVAEGDGRVVGYAALLGSGRSRAERTFSGRGRGSDWSEVRAVYVAPAWAGRGVGSALLATVERSARRAGAHTLVCVASLNAVPFYRARGFRVLRATLYESPRGFTIPAVRMRKDLNSGLAATRNAL